MAQPVCHIEISEHAGHMTPKDSGNHRSHHVFVAHLAALPNFMQKGCSIRWFGRSLRGPESFAAKPGFRFRSPARGYDITVYICTHCQLKYTFIASQLLFVI